MSLFDSHRNRSADRPDPPVPQPTPQPTHHPLEGLGRVALAGEIELRNRAFCITGSQRMAALVAVFVPFVVLVAVVAFVLAGVQGGLKDRSMEEFALELLALFVQTLSENAMQLVAIGLTTVFSIAGLLRGMRERLFVGPEGIRYFSGLPRWFGPFEGSWSVSASQIRDIHATHGLVGTAPNLVQLVIETAGKTRKLGVFTFVDPARFHAEAFGVLAGLRADWNAVAALFESMPLVEYARSIGHPVQLPEVPSLASQTQISLAGKPRVAVAASLVFVGFTYAVVDMGVISETYAAGAPIGMILLSGLGAGGLAWALLGSRELSSAGRAGVAGLLAATCMAALYPGLIRINRIGALDPEPHAYRHSEARTLEPVQPGSPRLDLPDVLDLLIGSQPGDVHQLQIRHGSLGFDQIDIDALAELIDELERTNG